MLRYSREIVCYTIHDHTSRMHQNFKGEVK